LLLIICTAIFNTVPKASKTTSYFDITAPTPSPHSNKESSSNTTESDSLFPNKYDYKEDWGEKYTGVSELGLYILHIDSGRVMRIPDVPRDLTAGQPVFTPCGRWVFTPYLMVIGRGAVTYT
jgi:hypothetical protein